MKSVIAHAILALGGLILAYLVWTHETSGIGADEVVLFECTPERLERVELRTEQKDITLEVSREGSERVIWIRSVRRSGEGEEGEGAVDHFVGSEAAEEHLALLAPLRARRNLGELDATGLEEVGLDATEERLTLHCGGRGGTRSATFEIGGRSYGTGDRYLRPEGGGPVSLLVSDRLQPLESAEFRLMQRSLHTFELREVVGLTVTVEDRARELLHHNRLDEQRAEWVDAEQPERRNELYGNWLTLFSRLRVQRYLGPEAAPGDDIEGQSVAPVTVLTMSYRGERGDLGRLELSRVDAEAPSYYARTDTTRSWVKVTASVAREIEDDARSVVGLPPLARPESVVEEAPVEADEVTPTEGEDPPDATEATDPPAEAPED